MVEYTRYKSNNDVYTYKKGYLFIKPDRVPADVMEKFEFSDSVRYEDLPEKDRCLFCEAPESHFKTVNVTDHKVDLMTVPLCDYHYYNQSLGSIVAQININKKEERKRQDGINSKVPKRSETKRVKSKTSKSKT